MCHFSLSSSLRQQNLQSGAIAPHRTLQRRTTGLRRAEGGDPRAEVGCGVPAQPCGPETGEDMRAAHSLGGAGPNPVSQPCWASSPAPRHPAPGASPTFELAVLWWGCSAG